MTYGIRTIKTRGLDKGSGSKFQLILPEEWPKHREYINKDVIKCPNDVNRLKKKISVYYSLYLLTYYKFSETFKYNVSPCQTSGVTTWYLVDADV